MINLHEVICPGHHNTTMFCRGLGISGGQEFEDLGMTLEMTQCQRKIKTVRETVMSWVVERKTGLAECECKSRDRIRSLPKNQKRLCGLE
jgi:hypothetical protein